jgi:hypothetical protein
LTQLVQPLFDGPVDIIGDIHGEIDALENLLGHLGYSEHGVHPDGRRLVFVGDLTDRGPDSPTVVEIVKSFVEAGRAQCVMGNHEFNILLGQRKHDNHWFFGEEWSLDYTDEPTPAKLADDTIRTSVTDFFKSLPLALERDDVRVVHACWDDSMVDKARDSKDAEALHDEHRKQIYIAHEKSNLDEIGRGLEHQNRNPVKVITSGKEERVEIPFEASGKLRYEDRIHWWHDYDEKRICVFGHYSFFKGEFNSPGRAICNDFAVAKRWIERQAADFDGTFRTKLAGLRIPEMTWVFDDGKSESLEFRE